MRTRNNINEERGFRESDYPKNYIIEGVEPEKPGLKIFIYKNIFEEINSFLAGALDREQGGVMIGNVFNDKNGDLFVVVDNFIIAQNTKSNITKLTFTHETWDSINNDMDKYYADKIIVGWFHSHPGHKVFLSGYDLFIQENFFNENFNFAYVYDPINNDKGIFIWFNGKIIKAGCYYLVENNMRRENDLNQSSKNFLSQNNNEEMTGIKINSFKNWFIIILLCLNILISIILYLNYRTTDKELESIKENLIQLKSVNMNLEKMDLKLNDLLLNQISKKDTINTQIQQSK